MNERVATLAFRAVLKVSAEPETKDLILAVLTPELSHQNPSRSSVSIDASTDGFCVRVKARDLSSFRASFTSILRLISVIIDMQRIVKNEVL